MDCGKLDCLLSAAKTRLARVGWHPRKNSLHPDGSRVASCEQTWVMTSAKSLTCKRLSGSLGSEGSSKNMLADAAAAEQRRPPTARRGSSSARLRVQPAPFATSPGAACAVGASVDEVMTSASQIPGLNDSPPPLTRGLSIVAQALSFSRRVSPELVSTPRTETSKASSSSTLDLMGADDAALARSLSFGALEVDVEGAEGDDEGGGIRAHRRGEKTVEALLGTQEEGGAGDGLHGNRYSHGGYADDDDVRAATEEAAYAVAHAMEEAAEAKAAAEDSQEALENAVLSLSFLSRTLPPSSPYVPFLGGGPTSASSSASTVLAASAAAAGAAPTSPPRAGNKAAEGGGRKGDGGGGKGGSTSTSLDGDATGSAAMQSLLAAEAQAAREEARAARAEAARAEAAAAEAKTALETARKQAEEAVAAREAFEEALAQAREERKARIAAEESARAAAAVVREQAEAEVKEAREAAAAAREAAEAARAAARQERLLRKAAEAAAAEATEAARREVAAARAEADGARLEAAKAEERAAQARATRRRSGVAARLALLLLLLLLVATAVVAPPVALLPLLQLPPDWPAPLLRHSLPAGWLAALPTGWSGDEEGRGRGTAWRPPWWSWSATGPSRLVLRSAVDGQCLQLMSERPRLRFGPCNGAHADDAHAFASFDGTTLTSSDFSTKLYLPPPLPLATLAATSSSADHGLSTPSSSTKVCLDRRCLRCLARGNANAVRIVFCALSGYEPFALPAKAPAA